MSCHCSEGLSSEPVWECQFVSSPCRILSLHVSPAILLGNIEAVERQNTFTVSATSRSDESVDELSVAMTRIEKKIVHFDS